MSRYSWSIRSIPSPKRKEGVPGSPRCFLMAQHRYDIAGDSSLTWETVVLAEEAKVPIIAERKFLRCFSCRADGSRNYVKPGDEIWLYLRKYAGDEIKNFICNALADLSVGELDRTATLRWPIEQCFEECKGNLEIGDYECRSYQGWNRNMLFVMITHLFATQIWEIFIKSNPIDNTNGN